MPPHSGLSREERGDKKVAQAVKEYTAGRLSRVLNCIKTNPDCVDVMERTLCGLGYLKSGEHFSMFFDVFLMIL